MDGTPLGAEQLSDKPLVALWCMGEEMRLGKFCAAVYAEKVEQRHEECWMSLELGWCRAEILEDITLINECFSVQISN